MATSPSQGPVIQVKAQPDVYTILMLLAIIALTVAIVVAGWKLTAPAASGGYGLSFGQLVQSLDTLPK
jgi:hypothetical protein